MKTAVYERLFESIPLGVMVVDRRGHIQAMNGYARRILAIADTQVMDRPVHELLGSVPIEEMLRHEQPAESRVIKVRHGNKVLEIASAPLKAGKGDPEETVITVRDVTEAEKMQAAEKIDEKYALIGDLSADIAHEIRNPLGSIELLASLLKKESKRAKDIHRANQIMAAVKNVEGAISSLIHRSQRDRLPVAHVNIHDLLKEILLFSEEIIDGGAVFLSARYADVEPVVECNADMMKQVFLHLILTALPGAGCLDIVTCHIEERGTIEIHFIEKGKPDAADSRDGAFHRLSRAKEDHWGLGLAIVHNIVDMYQGNMRVEYREDVGAALVISFPLLKARSPEADETADPIETRKEANEEK